MKFETFETFSAAFCEQLSKKVEADVTTHIVTKNNGVVLHGVSVQGEKPLSSVMYLENFYQKYQAGETMESLINGAMEVLKGQVEFNLEGLTDWETVREKIFPKVVSLPLNAERLKQDGVVFIPEGDLALVFQVDVSDRFSTDDGSKASFAVLQYHANSWEVDANELRRIAYENVGRANPYMVYPISDLIEMLGESSGEDVPLYVVATRDRMDGASVLLAPGFMYDLAEKFGTDLWIIPSSVHEILVLPDNGETNADTLSAMVGEVNDSCLDPMEVLSDHVYRYSKETGLVAA